MIYRTRLTSSFWEKPQRIYHLLNCLQSGIGITSIRLIWPLVKLCVVGVQWIILCVCEIPRHISCIWNTSIISSWVDVDIPCALEYCVRFQLATANWGKHIREDVSRRGEYAIQAERSVAKNTSPNETYLRHRRWYHQLLLAKPPLNRTTIDRRHLGWGWERHHLH